MSMGSSAFRVIVAWHTWTVQSDLISELKLFADVNCNR